MKNTKQIGDISEAMIIARYIELGYSISKPFGDNQPYDLILDKERKLYKVQCKTAKLDGSTLRSKIWKNAGIGKTRRKLPYTRDEVDIFAIYSPHTQRCYSITFQQVEGSSDICLCLYNTKTFKMARDYEIGIYTLLDISPYQHKCSTCNNMINLNATSCKSCLATGVIKKKKIDWPSNEELFSRLKESNFLQLSKELGVSDNAIRKHLRL